MKKLKPHLLTLLIAIIVFYACKTKQVVPDENTNKTNTHVLEGQKNDSISISTSAIGEVQTKDTIKQENKLKSKMQDTTVYTFAEVMPQYPGGDMELRKYIAKNIDLSNLGNIEPWGKAYVRFMVTQTGEIDSIRIMNKIPSAIEEKIYDVVKSLPKWQPGSHRGYPVKVWRTIIINEPL